MARARQLLLAYLANNHDNFAAWRAYGRTLVVSSGQADKSAAFPAFCPPAIARYWQVQQQPGVTQEACLIALTREFPTWQPWLSLDLAQLKLKNHQYRQGEEHLLEALDVLGENAEAYLTGAWLALKQSKWERALNYARKAYQCNPYLAQPYFFEAAQELIAGNYSQAMSLMQHVRLLTPGYIDDGDKRFGYFTACHREIASLCEQELWQTALDTSDEALKFFPEHAWFLGDKGRILSHLGKTEEAAVCLAKAINRDPYRLPAVQSYRRLLLRQGRYREAFAIWQKLVPATILYHPQNRLRAKYLRLEKAITTATKSDQSSLLELARAMCKVGWEEEAAIVYAQIHDTAALAEQQQLRNHLKFVDGIRKMLYTSYNKGEGNIISLLRQTTRLAKQLGIPLRTWPSREFTSYFVVAREVDPFAPKQGTLGHYLAQYNKFLDLGNNYGYVEGRLLNGISLRSHDTQIWGKPFSYEVILGDETAVETYLGYHSGGSKIAGRAFLSGKGFYIALDTIRPSAYALERLYERLQKPLPVEFPQTRPDIFPYLAGVADGLLGRSFAGVLPLLAAEYRRWDILYQELLIRQIDVVHHHELGHLVDFPCFLPVYTHLGNIVAMIWEQNFSPQRIHTRFETTAEVFGLAHAEDAYFYLYQEMERLDIEDDGIFGMVYWAWYGKLPDEDPYYRTARKIFEDLLAMRGNSDDWRNLLTLPQWPATDITECARRLCQTYGIARRCDREEERN